MIFILSRPLIVIFDFRPSLLTLDNIYEHIHRTSGISANLLPTLDTIRSRLILMVEKNTAMTEGAIYIYSEDLSIMEELESIREEYGGNLLEVIQAMSVRRQGKVH